MHFDAIERMAKSQAQFKFGPSVQTERRRQILSTSSRASAAQQRRYPRHHFDVRVQVSVFRDGQTVSYWGRTNEIGRDGIGATLSGALVAGEVVSLEFPVPIAPRSISLRAIVRYSQGLRVGLEFLVLTEQQKLTLNQLAVMLANAS
jgi:hypothetical protein